MVVALLDGTVHEGVLSVDRGEFRLPHSFSLGRKGRLTASTMHYWLPSAWVSGLSFNYFCDLRLNVPRGGWSRTAFFLIFCSRSKFDSRPRLARRFREPLLRTFGKSLVKNRAVSCCFPCSRRPFILWRDRLEPAFLDPLRRSSCWLPHSGSRLTRDLTSSVDKLCHFVLLNLPFLLSINLLEK